ncbi:hypothetical protein EOM39_03320 [Candidatus Gracilibacteria bacterium]|nr:hypothetical protein [Candidatus Gracilibacteria bacterium]
MSNYITEKNGKRYACIDGYYGGRNYGYVELKEGETWMTFSIAGRKVYTEKEFNLLK